MVIHKTYRIVRKLGQGGMGTVYLAQHIHMGEPRALKFLSPELSRDQALTSRFLREVRTLRQIRNRNVVDCGDLEAAEDDSLFFSMEFVDGPDLRTFLNDVSKYLEPEGGKDTEGGGGFNPRIKPIKSTRALAPEKYLPVPLALSIIRQIAEGLGAAHSKGMVHRDIKPENILMARDGAAWLPKIADFGIVATKESSTAYTRTGGTLLTMAYAAPEQWRGTPAAQLDGRTDLYALSGVLYEMLTGQTPFHAENYEGWARQHQTTPPPPPSALRPDLANWQGLDALVLRLLAKDRNDRPKDVAELLGLLDAVRCLPPYARLETVAEYAGKRSKGKHSRRVSIWVWAVSIVVLIVATFAGMRVFWPKQPASEGSGVRSVPPDLIDEPLPHPSPSSPAAKPLTADWSTAQLPPPPPGYHLVKPKGNAKTPVQQSSTVEIEKQANALYDQKRYEEAKPLFQKACESGNLSGCNSEAILYDYGRGVAQDFVQARVLYQKACDGGEMAGCYGLGWIYHFGQGVTQDYAHARMSFQKACDGGNVDGCYGLGRLYETGHGVNQDSVQARLFYQKACDAGSMSGCNALGVIYDHGDGLNQDYAQARLFYQKACDAGSMTGCFGLGRLYGTGHGVNQDYTQARELFQRSCDGGEMSGCIYLGFMYYHALGVAKDYSRAATLYSKACDAGIANGCAKLGAMYKLGEGVALDNFRAASLFSKACDGGVASGCGELGDQYAVGLGVKVDSEKAKQLHGKGCSMGYQKACDDLKKMK